MAPIWGLPLFSVRTEKLNFLLVWHLKMTWQLGVVMDFFQWNAAKRMILKWFIWMHAPHLRLGKGSALQCPSWWASPNFPRIFDSLEWTDAKHRWWDPNFDFGPNLAIESSENTLNVQEGCLTTSRWCGDDGAGVRLGFKRSKKWPTVS